MNETTAPRRGAIYVRLSKDTRDAMKIEDQLTMCRRLAESVGIEVVAVYNEGTGVSAFTGVERPEWERMLMDVRRGKFDVLIAQSEDRFARQLSEGEPPVRLCRRRSHLAHAP